MTTHETTITCDWCRNEKITGEPARQGWEAWEHAQRAAYKAGWLWDNVNWLCPVCLAELDRTVHATEMAGNGI